MGYEDCVKKDVDAKGNGVPVVLVVWNKDFGIECKIIPVDLVLVFLE